MFRITLLVIFCFLALLVGFFFAGVSGALFFGFLILLAWKVLKRSPLRAFVAGWFFRGLMLSLAGYILMWFFGLLGFDCRLHDKIADMRSELVRNGHRPTWFIISQKRSTIYNAVLPNSVKKSKHLHGLAIDLYVVDVDGNGRYDRRDFDLIRDASVRCERRHPGYRGSVYHYLARGSWLSRHMVHVELE
jgi:hypothetical protein